MYSNAWLVMVHVSPSAERNPSSFMAARAACIRCTRQAQRRGPRYSAGIGSKVLQIHKSANKKCQHIGCSGAAPVWSAGEVARCRESRNACYMQTSNGFCARPLVLNDAAACEAALSQSCMPLPQISA